jgi:hypothetical protein
LQEQITTCGGIHSEKRKGRKSTFLFTAQLLGKWNLFQDFQRVQIYSIAHKKQKRITAGTHYLRRSRESQRTPVFVLGQAWIILETDIP